MTLEWLVKHAPTPADHLTKTFPNPTPKAPTTHLPPKRHVHEDGTVTAPNWNGDATESEVTRSATRSHADTLEHPNPFGDPPSADALYKPAQFERHDIPEPTVSFEDGVKTVTQHAPSIARHVKTTPIASGETVPRKKIVGARSRKVGS